MQMFLSKIVTRNRLLALTLISLLAFYQDCDAQVFESVIQHTDVKLDDFIGKVQSGGAFSSMKFKISDTLVIGGVEVPVKPNFIKSPYIVFDHAGIPLFYDLSLSSTHGWMTQFSSSDGLLTNWAGTSWRGVNYTTSQVSFGIIEMDDTVQTSFQLQRSIGPDTLKNLRVKARHNQTLFVEDQSKPLLSFSGCSNVSSSSTFTKTSLVQCDTNGIFLCARQLWRPLRTSSGCFNTKMAANQTRIAIGTTHQGDVLVLDEDTFSNGYPLCSRILAILDRDMNTIRTIRLSNVTHIVDLRVDSEGYTYCVLFVDATSCSSTTFQIDGETFHPANQSTPNSKSIVALRFKPDGTRDWMHVLDAGSQGWPNLTADYPILCASYDEQFTTYLYVRNVTNANLEPLGSKKQVFYAINPGGDKLVWDSVSSVASGYEMMNLIGLDSAVQIFDLTTGSQKFGDYEFPRRTVPGTRNLNVVNWQPFFNLKSSLESISKQRAYQVVPNPSSGSFQIMGLSGTAQVEVLSLDGRLIEALSYSPGAEVYSLVQLSSGVYLLKVTEDFKTSTLKVVKQ